MGAPEQEQAGEKKSGLVRCAGCRYFDYFPNELGHNSPHALGKCGARPWDGNKGQWPMFQHPCRHYQEK